MKLSTGLSVCLAVLVTGLYTWGIASDPDGFGGLVRDREQKVRGAVLLGADSAGRELASWRSLAARASQAVVFKLAPPDAKDLDTGFQLYLDGLKKAAQNHDIDGVLSRSADNIIMAFGHKEGRQGLALALNSEEAWTQLVKLVSLPAARADDGSYCAPWFSCLDMPAEAGLIEPFETVFVTGENIPVYARPSKTSAPVVHLSHDAVRLAERSAADNLQANEPADWLKVTLPAGRVGYIAREQAHMMFDAHAAFEQLPSGLWTMTAFVMSD